MQNSFMVAYVRILAVLRVLFPKICLVYGPDIYLDELVKTLVYVCMTNNILENCSLNTAIQMESKEKILAYIVSAFMEKRTNCEFQNFNAILK